MLRRVGERRSRIEQHRREGDRSFWSNLGLIGVVGWSIILPAVGGAFLGRYLDRVWNTGTMMTLSLLLFGLVLGCWGAWRIVNERRD